MKWINTNVPCGQIQWLTFFYLSNCYGSPNPFDILFIGSDSLILLAFVFVQFLSMQWTGGVTASASYEFSYTKSTSTTDSTGKEQTTKFTISSTKTLGSHKSAEWRIMLSKQRVTYLTLQPSSPNSLLSWMDSYAGEEGIMEVLPTFTWIIVEADPGQPSSKTAVLGDNTEGFSLELNCHLPPRQIFPRNLMVFALRSLLCCSVWL